MAETVPEWEWEGTERARQRADLIDAALKGKKHHLRFPPALEAQFERRTGPDRCRGFVRYGLMGFVLCNIFIFNYFRLLPDIAWRELLVQFALVTPAVLAVTAYMRTEPPAFQREMTQTCAALLGLVVPVIAYQGSVYPAAIFFRYAPILTLLYINVAAAVRFRFALPGSAIAVLCNAIDLWLLKGISSDVKGLVATSVITTCGFTLLANHRLEREQRRTYLLNERKGLQRDELICLAGRTGSRSGTTGTGTGAGHHRGRGACRRTAQRASDRTHRHLAPRLGQSNGRDVGRDAQAARHRP